MYRAGTPPVPARKAGAEMPGSRRSYRKTRITEIAVAADPPPWRSARPFSERYGASGPRASKNTNESRAQEGATSKMKKIFRPVLWILVLFALAAAACTDSDEDERRGERSEGQPPAASTPGTPSTGTQPAPPPATSRWCLATLTGDVDRVQPPSPHGPLSVVV